MSPQLPSLSMTAAASPMAANTNEVTAASSAVQGSATEQINTLAARGSSPPRKALPKSPFKGTQEEEAEGGASQAPSLPLDISVAPPKGASKKRSRLPDSRPILDDPTQPQDLQPEPAPKRARTRKPAKGKGKEKEEEFVEGGAGPALQAPSQKKKKTARKEPVKREAPMARGATQSPLRKLAPKPAIVDQPQVGSGSKVQEEAPVQEITPPSSSSPPPTQEEPMDALSILAESASQQESVVVNPLDVLADLASQKECLAVEAPEEEVPTASAQEVTPPASSTPDKAVSMETFDEEGDETNTSGGSAHVEEDVEKDAAENMPIVDPGVEAAPALTEFEKKWRPWSRPAFKKEKRGKYHHNPHQQPIFCQSLEPTDGNETDDAPNHLAKYRHRVGLGSVNSAGVVQKVNPSKEPPKSRKPTKSAQPAPASALQLEKARVPLASAPPAEESNSGTEQNEPEMETKQEADRERGQGGKGSGRRKGEEIQIQEVENTRTLGESQRKATRGDPGMKSKPKLKTPAYQGPPDYLLDSNRKDAFADASKIYLGDDGVFRSMNVGAWPSKTDLSQLHNHNHDIDRTAEMAPNSEENYHGHGQGQSIRAPPVPPSPYPKVFTFSVTSCPSPKVTGANLSLPLPTSHSLRPGYENQQGTKRKNDFGNDYGDSMIQVPTEPKERAKGENVKHRGHKRRRARAQSPSTPPPPNIDDYPVPQVNDMRIPPHENTYRTKLTNRPTKTTTAEFIMENIDLLYPKLPTNYEKTTAKMLEDGFEEHESSFTIRNLQLQDLADNQLERNREVMLANSRNWDPDAIRNAAEDDEQEQMEQEQSGEEREDKSKLKLSIDRQLLRGNELAKREHSSPTIDKSKVWAKFEPLSYEEMKGRVTSSFRSVGKKIKDLSPHKIFKKHSDDDEPPVKTEMVTPTKSPRRGLNDRLFRDRSKSERKPKKMLTTLIDKDGEPGQASMTGRHADYDDLSDDSYCL